MSFRRCPSCLRKISFEICHPIALCFCPSCLCCAWLWKMSSVKNSSFKADCWNENQGQSSPHTGDKYLKANNRKTDAALQKNSSKRLTAICIVVYLVNVLTSEAYCIWIEDFCRVDVLLLSNEPSFYLTIE